MRLLHPTPEQGRPDGSSKESLQGQARSRFDGQNDEGDQKLQHAMETEESPNVLLGADCVQSSVCDGLDGDRAVDGDKNTFSRTQQEKEARWEAQLDPQSNPIREVIVTLVTPNRAPVHVFALLTSVGQGRLSDAGKRCVKSSSVKGSASCGLPQNL